MNFCWTACASCSFKSQKESIWLWIYRAYFLFLFLYNSASTCIPDGYQKESSDFIHLLLRKNSEWNILLKKPYTFELLLNKKTNPRVIEVWFIIWEDWKRPHEGLPVLMLFKIHIEIQSAGALCHCHFWLPHSFGNTCDGKFYTVIQQHCNEIYWCHSLFTH